MSDPFLKKVVLYGTVALAAILLVAIISLDLKNKIAAQGPISIFKEEFSSNASQKFQKEKWQIDIVRSRLSRVKSLMDIFRNHLPTQAISSTMPAASADSAGDSK